MRFQTVADLLLLGAGTIGASYTATQFAATGDPKLAGATVGLSLVTITLAILFGNRR